MSKWIVAWALCAAASFWLLQHTSRRQYDLYTSDIAFFVFLSLFGPVSLGAAVVVCILDYLIAHEGRVVLRRRK